MGTRSITTVQGRRESGLGLEQFCTIYRQFDGYPEVMGEEIKAALIGREIVNGYQDESTQLNGPACLAAYLVGALKKGRCGNVYLYPPGTTGMHEDYVYTLTVEAGKPVNMQISSAYSGVIYDGSIDDFESSELEDEY